MRRTVFQHTKGDRTLFEIEVRVYRSRAAMMRAARKDARTAPGLYERMYADGQTYRGVCSTSGGPEAVLFLNEQDLEPGTVAHEMLHAALADMRRRFKGNPLRHRSTEEHLATAVGDLRRAFWTWWQKGKPE